jgi:branched-chain amino acid transport system permease protein
MMIERRALVGAVLLGLCIAVAGLLVWGFAAPYHQRLFFTFLVNLIAVVGLQVFMGNSDITHFGHIGFMGISAYVTAILATPVAVKRSALATAPFGVNTFELAPLVAVVVAILITLAVAFLVGLMMVRQAGVAATIATLAFLVIVHVVVMNWVDLTRGPRAFYGIPPKATIGWAVATAFGAIVLARAFRDSKWGLQLRASSEDVAAASAVGVPIRKLRFAAWMLSALIMAVAGALFTLFVGTISPKSFYFDLTFLTIAMLILGGMHSVTGAVVGCVIVTVGVETMRFLESGPAVAGMKLPEMFGLTGFFLGLVIVLSMAFRPSGLLGADEIDDIWHRRRLRKAGVEVS